MISKSTNISTTIFSLAFVGIMIGTFFYGLSCNSPQSIKHCIIVLKIIYWLFFTVGIATISGVMISLIIGNKPVSFKEGILFIIVGLMFYGLGFGVKIGLVSTLQKLL